MAEYFNHEHYSDPTAYSVIKSLEFEEKKKTKIRNGEGFMRWVYVASPYKGDVDSNVNNAKRYALFVSKQDFVPVTPHLYFIQFLNDNIEEERNLGLALGLQMLKRCHEMWVFGDYISLGMRAEVDFAIKHNISIRYFNFECKEVEKHGKAIEKQVKENGEVGGVSYGTGIGKSLDDYKNIPITPMAYGQALAVIMFTEALDE